MRSLAIFLISIIPMLGYSQVTYIWNAGNGDWTTPTNWLPSRITPLATDHLLFNDGGTHLVTGIPTATIGGLTVTGNTIIDFQATTTSKTLTVGNVLHHLSVDAGSALTILNNSGVLLNITIASGSKASIGGLVMMRSGTFSIGDNILHLHSSSTPIDRENGQFSIGTGGTLQFGGASSTGGPTIILPDNIFVSDPTINNILINRTNGVSLGNQSISINGNTTMILGDLITNAAGRIKFTNTATSPVETTNSKIIGYAEMLSRTVGTNLLSFLGFELVSGSTTDIGVMSLLRKTGAAGINTFNGNESIASTWDITTSIEPLVDGRLISLKWFEDFDNGVSSTNQFQKYRFAGGPDWLNVGDLLSLQAVTNPRVSTPILTTQLTGPWTIADENNVLPLRLLAFEGKSEDEVTELLWTTASEYNVDYIEVQKTDDINEEFKKIGQQSAGGSEGKLCDYQFIDLNPYYGKNYYRLKVVDHDGYYEYSPIIMITNYQSLAKPLTVYPNPYHGGELNFKGCLREGGWITIRSIEGQTVMNVPYNNQGLTLETLDLPQGIYMVECINSDKRFTTRLMVR